MGAHLIETPRPFQRSNKGKTNMENQYTQIRIEQRDKTSMIEEIRHCLRTKKEKRAIKDSENYLWIEDKTIIYQRYEKEDSQLPQVMDYKEKLEGMLDSIEKEHAKRYRKTHNQSLNKRRTKSLASGIFTLSESFRELVKDNPGLMFELGVKTIQDVCKELDTELHYVSLHTDEEGIPHFHFFCNNYNSQGNSIKANRDKLIGQKIQDMSSKYFEAYGFQRGQSKDKTGRRYLSIEQYKEYARLKDQEQSLHQRVEEQKQELAKLANIITEQHTKISEQDTLIKEKVELFEELYRDLLEIQGTTHKKDYLTKLAEYLSKGKTQKLDKLLEKLKRHVSAASKGSNQNSIR